MLDLGRAGLPDRERNRPVLPELADDVHLAGLAVKAQGQFFIAADQDHRIWAQALDLFGAEIEAVAQAVLGDHQ